MPGHRPGSLTRHAIASVALAALLTACSSTPMPTPVATVAPTPTGDGVFRVGTLVASGEMGDGQVAGVNAAVREINSAGGVNGTPVEVITRNAGDASSDRAEVSFDELVARGVDIVIGPAMAALVDRLAPKATSAEVPLVSLVGPEGASPTSAGRWLFWITPRASVQGSLLAGMLVDGGATRVALIHGDDAFSTEFAAGLGEGLGVRDAQLVADISVGHDAVVLVQPDGGDATAALIASLSELGETALTLVGGAVADYGASLPTGALESAHGIRDGFVMGDDLRAQILREDPGATSLRFAAEAYDATMLVALAASLAHDDGGASIARELVAASADGIPCHSFGECLDVLSTRDDIAYSGPTGMGIGADGSPRPLGLGRYEFTSDNVPKLIEWIIR